MAQTGTGSKEIIRPGSAMFDLAGQSRSSKFLLLICICTTAFHFGFAQQSATTRYFLNEIDFISDYSTNLTEISAVPFIKVEYDNLQHVTKKIWYDSFGTTILTQNFSYHNETNELSEIKTYNTTSDLIEWTIYGGDSLSLLFAEYSLETNISVGWDDRYTIQSYSGGKIDSCRFFNAGGKLLGIIEYKLSSGSELASQIWRNVETNYVVREWRVITNQTSGVTRMVELDRYGHVVRDIRLNSEGQEEAIEIINPWKSTAINAANISYQLYTDISEGSFSWDWIAGTEDVLGSHVYNPYGVELIAGTHQTDYSFAPSLIENACYRITFTGVTTRGNPVIPVSIDSVWFDKTPPDITLTVVANSLRPQISYLTSESLMQAVLKFESLAGIVAVPFTVAELSIRKDSLFVPTELEALDSTLVYSAELHGRDQAGNWAVSAPYQGIRFDSQPPAITVMIPQQGSRISNSDVQFQSNEDLHSAEFIWISENGDSLKKIVDLESPATPDSISYLLSDSTELLDEMTYQLQIKAIDLYGNVSEVISISGMVFDITPPLITSIFPYSDGVMENKSVSFIFSEEMGSAVYRWETYSGAIPVAPLTARLTREELAAGEKINLLLSDMPQLLPGNMYRVVISGVDVAGNPSDPVILENVLFRPIDK